MIDPSLLIPEIDFCVVDTETTGGRADSNRVIEVAAFHVRDGIILDKFQTLLHPGMMIPEWITMLTGIDNSMVKNAPRFGEIAPRLREFLQRGVFVAHNAGFDYAFLQSEFARLGETWERPKLCTVRLARQLLPELPSRSLGCLCDHLLIDIYDRHRAAGDAEATVYVLKHFLRELGRKAGVSTWHDLDTFVSLGPLELPTGITFADLVRLPVTEGCYALLDEAGQEVSSGKCTNVRRRVANYFKRSNRTAKAALLRSVVRSIQCTNA